MPAPSPATYYRTFASRGPESLIRYLGHSRELVRSLVVAGLEAGLAHSDAARMALAVFREVSVLARDRDGNLLPPEGLWDVYDYAAAVVRSGSTFAAFEIATRAVKAREAAEAGIVELLEEWDPDEVDRRLRVRAVRKRAYETLVERQTARTLGKMDTDE